MFIRELLHKILPSKVAQLYDKLEQAIWYAFFGVVTTLVNVCVYTLLTRWILADAFLQNKTAIATLCNTVAWFVAVLVAFFTNKYFVFENQTKGKTIWVQLTAHFSARIVSGLIEIPAQTLLIYLGMYDLLAKVLVAIVVILSNYIFSKFVTFRSKKTKSGDDTSPPQSEDEE